MEQRRFIGCQTTDFRSSMYGTLTVYFVRTFSLPFFANSGQINIVLPQATQPSFFIRKSVPMRTFSRDLIKDALLRERKRKKLALGGIRTHSLLSFCARGVLQPLPFLYLRPTVAENSCSENYSKPNSKSSLNIATVYFVGYIFLLTGLKTYGRRQLCWNINLTICVAQFWKKFHQAVNVYRV